jgi:ParB family chromosome partitioning protein
VGKSRTAITETMAIAAIPENVRDHCRLADIHSKSLLLQVVRQSEPRKMLEFVERLKRDGAPTRQAARRILKEAKRPARGRPKNYAYRFEPSGRAFALTIQFRKPQVERDELIAALRSAIDDLLAN